MTSKDDSAFVFEGTWREFAPIALTNLLLTIVTLGIYRFWATTRERRYLWSRTRFIDDYLEWTGTALELFIGFLLVMLLLGGPFIFIQFGAQALVFQGYPEWAVGLTVLSLVVIFYFAGVARFRALRYRLSRTYWHGIRGGSDKQGWFYGLLFIGLTILGYLTAGLLIPWSMLTLWKRRWNAMSFGPYAFRSEGNAGALMKRFLLFYAIPFVLVIGAVALGVSMMPVLQAGEQGGQPPAAALLAFVAVILGFYLLLGLVALAFYAKFFRVAVNGMSLGDLEFQFTASTRQWIKLILGDVALVFGTLGIGYVFLSYRHWKFFITHLEAIGEIDFNALTQSTTREPGQGEGLLDAFDVGAI